MTEMLMLAAREHLDAQMAGDADRLALTSAFPFMQIQSDGHASVYDSPEDLVDSVDGTFQRKLVDGRLVDSGDGGAVLGVVAQRSDLEGKPIGLETTSVLAAPPELHALLLDMLQA